MIQLIKKLLAYSDEVTDHFPPYFVSFVVLAAIFPSMSSVSPSGPKEIDIGLFIYTLFVLELFLGLIFYLVARFRHSFNPEEYEEEHRGRHLKILYFSQLLFAILIPIGVTVIYYIIQLIGFVLGLYG